MNSMKRILFMATIVVALGTIAISSCTTSRESAVVHRPSEQLIQATLDSICKEGYNLYIAERVNWVATDSALKYCDEDQIGGNIIWQVDDSTWRVVFFDKAQEKCIFELQHSISNPKYVISHNPRSILKSEREQIKMKETMLENAIRDYGDSLRFNGNYGRPNVDIVRIDAHTLRMYILQGVELPNIIPFGNDYSIDFDNHGALKKFRRYHKSFIPIQTVSDDGKKVVTAFHSHTKDNPYITATDICNFLLYRGEMEQTYVLSTALDGYIIYDAKQNKAFFLTHEAMKKIVKD